MMQAPGTEEYKFPAPLPIQPEEVEVLEPKDRLSVAEWAAQKRKLSPKTSDIHGDWSHEYTPYLVPIMEWLSDDTTREITEMKCAQSGGTEAGLNFLGWAVDESPMPFLIVMPRETDATRRVDTRIRPMFESTLSLQKHLPRQNLDELNIGKETNLDNMILYIAWAGSAAAMADNPVCYIDVDEVGKFPWKVKREADPINLLKKRQTTFPAKSKFFCKSTPVTKGDLFDREYKAGIEHLWWVKCQHCGEYHVQKWKYYQLDKDENGRLLRSEEYRAGGHARYVCPECGACWSEWERWAAVYAGKYAPEGCTVDKNGNIVGDALDIIPHRSVKVTAFMQYPGWMTADILAAEWAAAQETKRAGDIEPLQDFINSRCAESWEEREKETEITKLYSHIGTYPAEMIPAGVQMLTAGGDVQLDHIWLTVLGWGYLSEVWTIFDGRIETGDTNIVENYELLCKILAMDFPLIDNPDRNMRIYKTAIDCGYRPDTVFDFCRRCTELNLVPVRGDPTVTGRMYRATKVAGGTLVRYDINVNAIKDRLYRLLFDASIPGPGYFHLHADTTDEVLRHLTSEEQRTIRKGRKTETGWFKKTSRRPNHLWDTRVYADFVAEISGARSLPDPSAPQQKQKRRIGRVQSRVNN